MGCFALSENCLDMNGEQREENHEDDEGLLSSRAIKVAVANKV
jgi:hypothetical protein